MSATSESYATKYATKWRQAAERPRQLTRRARNIVRHAYLDIASVAASSQAKPMLKNLCCHYVFDDQLVAFERLLTTLGKLGEFVTTDDCLAMARGERSIDACYFHLSFDDGFRNVITNAVPILHKLGVPASFFVPTRLIGAPYADARMFSILERYESPVEFANWDELRGLDPSLVRIGSHTMSHPRLSSISSNRTRLIEELTESKKTIEEQMGYECKMIAWPGGQPYDIDETSLQAAKEVGYEFAFGASGGAVRPGGGASFVVPRQHFEVQWPARHVTYLAKK